VYKISLAFFLLFSFHFASAHDDFSHLPKNKQTPQALYVNAVQAHEMKTDRPDSVYFVDVRTQSEVEFLGMATTVDSNIPYMFNDLDEWDAKKGRFTKVPNSNFSLALEERMQEAGLDKDTVVLLMCRSGTRSAKAAILLEKLGYTKAYTVVDGYEGDKLKEGLHQGKRLKNGWKNTNLPWSYKLLEDKMYVE
jgi:rhodanese-related sulfurtransferase